MPRARSIAHPAPKGRKTTAQGIALGNRPPMNLSPEGAEQGWRIAKISEFAKTTSGGTPSRANPEFYTGDIPWIKSGDLNDGNVSKATEFITKEALANSSAKLFPAGTLMIALYGATIGKLGVLTIEAATNQAVCGIFVPEEVETKYLFYFLLYHRPELIKLGAGGAQANISQGIIRDIEIPLPPLPEQRRIVARIEELFSRLDAGVSALRHAKAQLQRYRQSVLAAAVTGQLTREWREQHPDTEPAEELLKRILERRREEWKGRGKYTEPVDHDTTDLKELPQSWIWSSFEGVITELRNGISKKPDATEGLRILRISAVRPLAVDLDDSRFLSDSLSKFVTYKLEPNDLLFTRYNGTRAFVGVCGLVPKLPEPFVYPDKLIRARLVDQNALLPSFVEIAMNAGESRRFLEERIRTTAGQSGISGSDIKVTPLPIPPLTEQHQIVAEVEARTTAIDHLEAELDRQITRSNRLRQSILSNAFSGKLLNTRDTLISK